MNKKLILMIIGLYSVLWLTAVNAVTHNSPQQWRFKVYLDEQMIGYHTVTVNPEKTRATVTVEASFDVKFLFFTAYSYLHNTQETSKPSNPAPMTMATYCMFQVSNRTRNWS